MAATISGSTGFGDIHEYYPFQNEVQPRNAEIICFLAGGPAFDFELRVHCPSLSERHGFCEQTSEIKLRTPPLKNHQGLGTQTPHVKTPGWSDERVLSNREPSPAELKGRPPAKESVVEDFGGGQGIRTPGLIVANDALSQLS